MKSGAQTARVSKVWLYAGIFMMFGSLGMLIAMLQPRGGTWPLGLAMAVFSGTVALGWAYAFSEKRYWIIAPCMAIPFFVPEYLFGTLAKRGWFDLGAGLSHTARLAVLAVMIAIGVSIGFTLVIQFITRSEKLRARALAELDVARTMHETIVPPLRLTDALADVLARSEPSSEMGGDLVDVVVRENEIDFFLADVSGHGVGAGIVMGMLKASIRTRLLAGSAGREGSGGSGGGDLGGVLTDINSIACDLTRPDMFATMVAIRLRTGTAVCSLAGHLPIVHYRAAERAWGRVENRHLPLGIDPAMQIESVELPVGRGDLLIAFTDGLCEVFGAGGQFGLEGVLRVLEATPQAPLEEICDRVFAAARAHGPASDDQSILLVRVA